MLTAFRPQSLQVQVGKRWVEVEGYIALLPGERCPDGCQGIFHPGLIQLAAEEKREREGGTVHHGGR